MSEDLDFDMEVVGDDELDDMGADGTSSSADDGTRSDRKTTGVEVSEHSRSDSNRGTGTDEGTALANREEKIFERGGDVEGWKEKTLGSIFDSIYSGGTPKKGVDEYYGGDLPFVKIEDLNRQQGKGISSAETHITEKAVEETSTRALNVGTLLLTIYGSLAETALVRNRVATNQAILGLWDAEEENTLYVKYAIDYDQAKLQSLSRQTTQANLGKGIVAKHRLSVPPLPEQRKIASVLYAVDQAIQKTEAIIEQAKRVKSGLVGDLMTKGIGHDRYKEVKVPMLPEKWTLPEDWELKPLKELTSKITDGAHQTPTYVDEGVPFLKVKDIQSAEIDWAATSRIPVDEHESLTKRSKPQRGDILLSKNGTIGITKIVDWDREFSHFVSLALVRPIEEKIIPSYLSLILNSRICLHQAAVRSKTNTVTNLHLEEIKNFSIPLPPINEQEEIAKVLKSAQERIDGEIGNKQTLQRLKNGLMQDLLTGEVRTVDKAIEVLDEVAAHG